MKTLPSVSRALLVLNQYREGQGLPGLRLSSPLTQAAAGWLGACDSGLPSANLSNRGYSPDRQLRSVVYPHRGGWIHVFIGATSPDELLSMWRTDRKSAQDLHDSAVSEIGLAFAHVQRKPCWVVFVVCPGRSRFWW